MFIENLIDHSLFPLKSSDRVDFAIETMLSMQIDALPVLNNDLIVGFVESKTLVNAKRGQSINDVMRDQPNWIINEKNHFYETIKRMSEFHAGCLAVIDHKNKFIGIISKLSVIKFLANSYTQLAEGGVICIEMLSRNYSLNELTRIIENNDAKILGVSIFSIPDSSKIAINLKLNTIYTDRIISTLQRFGFEVTASFYSNHSESDFENRYQSLLKYLEF